MLYCRYCGFQLTDNAHFCTKCGKAVMATTPPPPPGQQTTQTAPPPPPNYAPQNKQPTTPPLVNTQPPTSGYSPQDIQQGVQKTFNSIRDIIAQLSDNDIKASATGGEIVCTSSPAQNAFLRLLRKGSLGFGIKN